jgi:hypothetical protein
LLATPPGDAQDFIGRFSERIRAPAANQDLLVRHERRRIDVKDLVPSTRTLCGPDRNSDQL